VDTVYVSWLFLFVLGQGTRKHFARRREKDHDNVELLGQL